MTPEERQELCALYAMGPLTQPEAGALEARLHAGDVDVAREVAAFRAVAELLPYALPAVSPTAAIRRQLLSRIATSLPATSAAPTVAPQRKRRGWLRAPLIWVPTAVALGLVLGWLVATLHWHVLSLEAELRQLRVHTGEHEQLKALLLSPHVNIEVLTGSTHAPTAGARLLWDRERRVWTIMAHDLPPLAPGKVYQLWFLAADAPLPSGTFRPNARGQGIMRAQLPSDRSDIGGAAVSVEPTGGVSQPTGNIVLHGTF